MNNERKKFKDTAIGKLITDKIPDGVALIGELLPDKGVLGIAKNIIDKSTLTVEEKQELKSELKSFTIEFYEAEARDRSNARWREVELAKVGGNDFIKVLAGITALAMFVLSVVTVLFQQKIGIDLTENPVANQIIGLIGGVALS